MTAFLEKLYFYITDKKLINTGDRICVGVSGGADSLCLLDSLFKLRRRLGIELYAFHVNHSLRGDESDTDQEYVEKYCEERNIPLIIYRFDIAALAKKNRQSLEEAGRNARREAAKECMKEFGANKTALAHHLNDCAETLLFNLARGTSLSGLKGITPVSGSIIRPLLTFGRKEIEEELRTRGTGWRTDSTNLKDDYTRNRLRLKILPDFEKNINPESVRHIADAAGDLEEADEIIRALADEKAEKLVLYKDDVVVLRSEALAEKNLILGYIILGAVKHLTQNVTDIKRRHIEQIKQLMKKQTGRSLDLPYGIKAERVYEGIRLTKTSGKTLEIAGRKGEAACPDADAVQVKLEIGSETRFGSCVFTARIINNAFSMEEIPKKKCTKWFDYDKLTGGLFLRNRLKDDYIVIDSQGHKKTLKRYFTDEKIPREKRDSIICVADGSRIIWVVGGRISEDCKVSDTTRRVIEIVCHQIK